VCGFAWLLTISYLNVLATTHLFANKATNSKNAKVSLLLHLCLSSEKEDSAWGCSLVVEHLPSMFEVLGSIPKAEGREKEKEREKERGSGRGREEERKRERL
jgi:hypothetical protein